MTRDPTISTRVGSAAARRLSPRYDDRAQRDQRAHRRSDRPPVHGRARPRHRGALAGLVDRAPNVRGAQPGRPAGRPGRHQPSRRQAVRARHVPVPVQRRAARRPPVGLRRHRRLLPVPAHAGQERPAHDGLRRLRVAGRAVRRADRHPSRHHDRRRGRHLSPSTPPAGHELRHAAFDRDDRPQLLPLDPVDLRPGVRLVVRPGGRAPRRWHGPGPAHRGADRRIRVRRPLDPRRP